MTKHAVNPGLWEGLDYLFGTTLAETAKKTIDLNIDVDFSDKKSDTDIIPMSATHTGGVIGTPSFDIGVFRSDVEEICGVMGFSKNILESIKETDDDKLFKQLLKVLDAVCSIIGIIPLDDIGEAKSFIKAAAQKFRDYLPDFKNISAILAKAPGINKYSKELIGFGDSLDEAIDVINRDDTSDSLYKAIEKIRDGIKRAMKLDINDINKSVDGAETVIEAEPVSVADTKNDNHPNKKSKTKKEEVVEVTDLSVSDSAAMPQNFVDPTAAWMQPITQQQQSTGTLPGFIQDGYTLREPDKHLPEFITQNRVDMPKMNLVDGVFAPIPQRGVIDPACNFPFVAEIASIANSNGYYINAYPVKDNGGNVAMVYIATFSGSTNAFLHNNSFVVDLGTVIDGRYGIWPCITMDGTMAPVETCNEAYMLNTRDGKLNAEFISEVIKFGFSNIVPDKKKKSTLYGLRMCETNRRISLITMGGGKNLSSKDRNIIRGACIRMATKLEPNIGRLRFKVINDDLSFVLTNENVAYYPYTAQPAPKVEIVCKPKLVDGKYVPVNPNGGSDIVYDIAINYQ